MIEQIEELNGQINVSGNVVGTIIGQNCSGGGGSGGGDMYKAVYDTDNNGIVDNAEKVNNHTVEKDVPSTAVFTDTTYTAGTGIEITAGNVINNTQTSAEWGNITGTMTDQTDLKNALDLKANASDIPDLTNYVTKTDYATSSTGGVVKINTTNGLNISSGELTGNAKSYVNYSSAPNSLVIAKGTLENVITGKGLVSSSSLSTVATSGSYTDLSNKPTIPTKTSDLTNDSEFKPIFISNNAPLDPEEDDLWLDTSESEEMQEAIKNEYSESISDTYSCDYINTYIDDRMNGITLWTNSNPSSAFSNQTVQFNAVDYDKFEVICRLSTSNDIRVCQTVYKGSEYRLMEVGYETNDNAFIRSVNINSSGAYFSDCSGYGVGSNTQFTPINNNALIPLEIKGFKAYIS